MVSKKNQEVPMPLTDIHTRNVKSTGKPKKHSTAADCFSSSPPAVASFDMAYRFDQKSELLSFGE